MRLVVRSCAACASCSLATQEILTQVGISWHDGGIKEVFNITKMFKNHTSNCKKKHFILSLTVVESAG